MPFWFETKLLRAGGLVIDTVEPSEYVMVVVVEPFALVTLCVVSPLELLVAFELLDVLAVVDALPSRLTVSKKPVAHRRSR